MGRVIEDTVDYGIALLMASGPFEEPRTVELYGADGDLLRSHPLHGGRPSGPDASIRQA